jgi:hypothetical protein
MEAKMKQLCTYNKVYPTLTEQYCIWLLLLLCVYPVSTAHALSTYDYVGKPFTNSATAPYTTSDKITMSFSVASPLSPNLPLTDITSQIVAYEIFDGVNTVTNLSPNTLVNLFFISTDGNGNIAEWVIAFVAPAIMPPVPGARQVSILTANCLTCSQGVTDFSEILECLVVSGSVCSGLREAGVANNAGHPGVWSTVEIIEIAIKPGSFSNAPINLKSKGVLPVAILGTPDFNVDDVAINTVEFAGASPVRVSFEDVNGDGRIDILFHFYTQDLQLTSSSTQATLTGETAGGIPFQGTGSIHVVP